MRPSTIEPVVMSERDASKLAAAVEAQLAEEARLVEEIAALRRREEAEIEEAMRQSTPTRGPGSKSEGTRRKRETAERRLFDIREFELPAARRLAAEATATLRKIRLEQAVAQARSVGAREDTAAQQIALAYEDLLRGYASLADAASDREDIYETLEQSGLLNGLDDNASWAVKREFQSTYSPFPVSPAALFEAIAPAVLDPHAGTDEHFAQREGFAARFVDHLAGARDEGLYRRCALRLTEMRSADADFNSATLDSAGGMAGRQSVATRIDRRRN